MVPRIFMPPLARVSSSYGFSKRWPMISPASLWTGDAEAGGRFIAPPRVRAAGQAHRHGPQHAAPIHARGRLEPLRARGVARRRRVRRIDRQVPDDYTL